jgi:Kelch motif/Galactose oxidase, central domain
MRTFSARHAMFLIIFLCTFLFALPLPKFEPLPAPLANNAVAQVKSRGDLYLFSFMGIGPKKTWDDVSTAAFILDPYIGKWKQIRNVPGPAGRLAAVAAGAREHVFLFGGYTVDAQGGEITVSDVNVYEPLTDGWLRGADMPIAVDDSVAGVYRDRYIYLVSGWSKSDAVNNVQVYDAEKNRWQQATPIPGRPVFGHAGAMAGDTIVYVDGAYRNPSGSPKYIASDECWIGKVDHKNPSKISWSKLPPHPGDARYRIAAGGSEKDHMIYFSGGSANPYNFNGIGYNGEPSEPSPYTFAFNLRSGKWETLNADTSNPTMDHRGLFVLPEGLILAGGMAKGQQVTPQVTVLNKREKGL